MARKRPIQLTFDFDGTLTDRDTLPAMVTACYDFQRRRGCKPSQSWDRIVAAYSSDFEAHTEAYKPSAPDRQTLTQELQWLDSLRDVERASITRVVKAGVFGGADEEVMEAIANRALERGDVVLRQGWIQLVERTLLWNRRETDGPGYGGVAVLSVNWSNSFVRSCLEWAAVESRGDRALSTVAKIAVFANELANVDATRASPQILEQTAPYVTARDKLDHLRYHDSVKKDSQVDTIRIYIGDSPTDLAPLIAADVGICMTNEPAGSGQEELLETVKRIGVETRDISQHDGKVKESKDYNVGLYDTDSDTKHEPLWLSGDFSEVDELVQRICASA